MRKRLFNIGNAKRSCKCCICGCLIKKGELILRANLGSGLFYSLFHLHCFIEEYKGEVSKLLNEYLKVYNPTKRV